MSRKIGIIGAGGFAREVAWLIQATGAGDRLAAFFETDAHHEAREVGGLPVHPTSRLDMNWDVVLAVGDPAARQAIASSLPEGLRFPNFIHPSALLGPRVELAHGTVICAGCILTCDIQVHRHVHLNLHTTVGHDCVLEDFVTTAPAVNISGRCHLGQGTYVGTNASLREGLRTSPGSVLGMGAVLVSSADEPGVYVGNPARRR